MNMHISPAAIAARRQATTARTADLDAKLKTAIDAHAAAVRAHNKAKREFDALVAKHPNYSSSSVTAADSAAAKLYWRERRRLGIDKAENIYFNAYHAEYRAFQKVLLISPTTRSGCRIAAKFLIRQLPRQVSGPLSNAEWRKASVSALDGGSTLSVAQQFSTRRSIAYDSLASFLLRLAE